MMTIDTKSRKKPPKHLCGLLRVKWLKVTVLDTLTKKMWRKTQRGTLTFFFDVT